MRKYLMWTIIAIAAIGVAVWLFINGTIQYSVTRLMRVSFPVSIRSRPFAIAAALAKSGYLSTLSVAQRNKATSDPRTWLNANPQLYQQYPAYFVQ